MKKLKKGEGKWKLYVLYCTYLYVFPHMRNRNIPLIGSISIINRLDQTACQNNQTDPAKYTCPYKHAKKRVNHQISLSSLEFSFSLFLSLSLSLSFSFLDQQSAFSNNQSFCNPPHPSAPPPPPRPRTKSHGGYLCTPVLPPPKKN